MEYNRDRDASGKFTETASVIISHSMSTIIDRKIAVRVTNTTESHYTINKDTQIAEFSVFTPEQSKFIKPVDMAALSMIPEGDPDLITYLTELLRTDKPDQQTNTFWFPTPENPGNTKEHTPIQTRFLKELCELQQKEKLNPKNDSETRIEFLKRFDWTNTLLTETEKQARQRLIFLILTNIDCFLPQEFSQCFDLVKRRCFRKQHVVIIFDP